MSDAALYGTLQSVTLQSTNIGIGSYIMNDYLITVSESDDGNGYTLEIKRGSTTQTIHLTELTQEYVDNAIETALNEAKDSGEFDGYSPTAIVTRANNITTLTVTDANGTTTADIYDGAEGYTPVKGVDYWTVADKTEMITDTTQSVLDNIDLSEYAELIDVPTRTSELENDSNYATMTDVSNATETATAQDVEDMLSEIGVI